jgi:type I restriction enzyme S subunit
MLFKESIKRFTLPKGWSWTSIGEVAKLSFSSVDKKSVEGESPVRLCNYMDVFYNRRIREGMPFMVSTASDSDIKKFTLNKGDVVLTKDSETPEEIAFAAVIDEQIDNLVCGYHLAVLRPDKTKATGEYLMSAINFYPNHHQFVRLANGATRFGLGIDSLNNALLPLPPLAEQRKIAEILRTWDEAIETAEAELKAKQERKRGLMQKLLNPSAEGAGALMMKGPQTVLLSKLGILKKGGAILREKLRPEGAAVILYGDIYTKYSEIVTRLVSRVDPSAVVDGVRINDGDIVFAGSGETAEEIGKCIAYVGNEEAYAGGDVVILSNHGQDARYLGYALNAGDAIRQKMRLGQGSSVMHLYKDDVGSIRIPLPPLAEQRKIAQVLQSEDAAIDSLKVKAGLLRDQKRGLMQKLLTGDVRVAA